MTMMGAPMGTPGLPPMGMAPGGMPPQDPTSMILTLLQGLMQKWMGQQDQVAGEQSGLVQTMMQLMQSAPPQAQAAFAEPSTGLPGYGMDDPYAQAGPPQGAPSMLQAPVGY